MIKERIVERQRTVNFNLILDEISHTNHGLWFRWVYSIQMEQIIFIKWIFFALPVAFFFYYLHRNLIFFLSSLNTRLGSLILFYLIKIKKKKRGRKDIKESWKVALQIGQFCPFPLQNVHALFSDYLRHFRTTVN